MKITRKQLQHHIKTILLEKDEPGFFDKVGRWISNEWGHEEINPRDARHPKLNVIVDAVNDAAGDVSYTEMKNFLWGLNHDYATGIKIESRNNMKITKYQLRKLIREAMHPMDDRAGESFYGDAKTSFEDMPETELSKWIDSQPMPDPVVQHVATSLEKRAFRLMRNHKPRPPLEEFKGDDDIRELAEELVAEIGDTGNFPRRDHPVFQVTSDISKGNLDDRLLAVPGVWV